MKPLEAVQVLAWLTYCRGIVEHYLNVASSMTPEGRRRCLMVAHDFAYRMQVARRNYTALTWKGGAA